MGRLHRMLILKACPYQQILSSKGAETTNGTASQHIHINKYVDLPDGSTIQIVDSGPLFTFLVIPKQQNGTRVLYGYHQRLTWLTHRGSRWAQPAGLPLKRKQQTSSTGVMRPWSPARSKGTSPCSQEPPPRSPQTP